MPTDSLNPRTLGPLNPSQIALSAVKSILVVQLTKMGDFLQTTPLLYRIKQKYPKASLTALIDSGNMELAQGVPLIDEIVPLDLRSIHQMMNDPKQSLSQKYNFLRNSLVRFKEKKFDLIYNINFSNISALLCQFFPKTPVIGYRLNPEKFELRKDPWVSFIFYLLRDRNLLRLNLVDLLASYETESFLPISQLLYCPKGPKLPDELLPLKSSQDITVGLQMGCGGILRKWPVRNFAALAFRIVNDLKGRVVLLGSKDEKYLSDEFYKEWGKISGYGPATERVLNLIGKTSLPQLAEALKRCHLLVTGDTGTMHLGSAVGTKILALFMGTALGHETGPYGEGHFIIQAEMPCFPCQQNGSCRKPICHGVITPELVYEFLSGIIRNPSGALAGDFYRENPSFRNINTLVQIYRSVMDRWGVKYLPIIPKKINIKNIMAIAYREIGRTLITPTYTINQEEIIDEISFGYDYLEEGGADQMEDILRSLSALQVALKSQIQDLPIAIKALEPTTSFSLLSPLYRFLIEGCEKKYSKSFQLFTKTLEQIYSLLEAIYSHHKNRSSLTYGPSISPLST